MEAVTEDVMKAVMEDVMEAVMEDITEAMTEVVSRNLKLNDKHVPKKRKTRAELAHPIEDVPRRRTRAELALIPPPVENVLTKRRTRAELAFYPPPIADVPTRSTPRAELAEDGHREFNPDIEFSRGRKERAKDWKRQKVNRVLKAGIKEAEHATTTGRAIGTQRASLTDHQLSDNQKRVYLELQEQEELSEFKIPNTELEAIGVKAVQQFIVVINIVPINRRAYARFNEPTECDTVSGYGTSDIGPNTPLAIDSRIDEDIGTDIEEDYDDKLNKQDDDEDIGLWGRWGKVLSVPSGDRPAELLPSDTKNEDYRDSTEENDCEVNERVYQWILRQGAAMTTSDNNKDDKGEKQVTGNDGEKDEPADEDEGNVMDGKYVTDGKLVMDGKNVTDGELVTDAVNGLSLTIF
ncbi:hypothetical protein BGX38DRAFT_1271475 [Terfezia claveryi]|nr:hypothetical protein BGX38DRAFT_1271475 [Terfezia claveryi]